MGTWEAIGNLDFFTEMAQNRAVMIYMRGTITNKKEHVGRKNYEGCGL